MRTIGSMRNDDDSDSLRPMGAEGSEPDWASLTVLLHAEPVRAVVEATVVHARQRRHLAPSRRVQAASAALPDMRSRPEWGLPYAQRAAAQLIDTVRAGQRPAAAAARALRRIVSALSADGRRTLARWLALQVATAAEVAVGGCMLAVVTRVDLALAAQVRRQLPRVRSELAGPADTYATAYVA